MSANAQPMTQSHIETWQIKTRIKSAIIHYIAKNGATTIILHFNNIVLAHTYNEQFETAAEYFRNNINEITEKLTASYKNTYGKNIIQIEAKTAKKYLKQLYKKITSRPDHQYRCLKMPAENIECIDVEVKHDQNNEFGWKRKITRFVICQNTKSLYACSDIGNFCCDLYYLDETIPLNILCTNVITQFNVNCHKINKDY